MRLPKLHLRFSLKVLLLFTLLVGFLLVPFCIKLDRARKQKELVEDIRRRGGIAKYAWEESGTPPSGNFLRRNLGDDFFDDVVSIWGNDFESLDDNGDLVIPDVSYLCDGIASLRELRDLNLNMTRNFDFQVLPKLRKLEHLALGNCDISDGTPIGQLKELKTLSLIGTKVDSIEFVSTLPNLDAVFLINTPVSDLSPLSQATSLRYLHINRTEVLELKPLHGLSTLRFLSVDSLPTGPKPAERMSIRAAIPNLNLKEVDPLVYTRDFGG